MKKVITVLSLVLIVMLVGACSKKEYNLFSTIYGVVTNHETGEAIENANVLLSPGGKTQTTNHDGQYEFNDLEAQQYTLTIQRSGYQTNRKTITAVASERTEANIPLIKN